MRMLRDRGTAPRVHGPAERRRCRRAPSVLDRVRDRGVAARRLFRGQPAVRVLQQRAASWSASTSRWRMQLARDLGVRRNSCRSTAAIFDKGLDPAVVRPRDVGRGDDGRSGDQRAVLGAVPRRDGGVHRARSSARRRSRTGRPSGRWAGCASACRERRTSSARFATSCRTSRSCRSIGMDEMFAPHDPPLDAFVATAERGSAYTLLHPEYSVAVPKPRPVKVPLAYVIAGRDAADDRDGQHVDRAEAEGRHDRRAVRALDSRAGRDRGEDAALVGRLTTCCTGGEELRGAPTMRKRWLVRHYRSTCTCPSARRRRGRGCGSGTSTRRAARRSVTRNRARRLHRDVDRVFPRQRARSAAACSSSGRKKKPCR